jgi:hypothetical protein
MEGKVEKMWKPNWKFHFFSTKGKPGIRRKKGKKNWNSTLFPVFGKQANYMFCSCHDVSFPWG